MPIFSVNLWSAGSPHVFSRILRWLPKPLVVLALISAQVLLITPLLAQQTATPAAAGQPQTIIEIRIIGSRRIPQETI